MNPSRLIGSDPFGWGAVKERQWVKPKEALPRGAAEIVALLRRIAGHMLSVSS